MLHPKNFLHECWLIRFFCPLRELVSFWFLVDFVINLNFDTVDGFLSSGVLFILYSFLNGTTVVAPRIWETFSPQVLYTCCSFLPHQNLTFCSSPSTNSLPQKIYSTTERLMKVQRNSLSFIFSRITQCYTFIKCITLFFRICPIYLLYQTRLQDVLIQQLSS